MHTNGRVLVISIRLWNCSLREIQRVALSEHVSQCNKMFFAHICLRLMFSELQTGSVSHHGCDCVGQRQRQQSEKDYCFHDLPTVERWVIRRQVEATRVPVECNPQPAAKSKKAGFWPALRFD